jgi:enoyl-CoA hydratase/carnithine racemase
VEEIISELEKVVTENSKDAEWAKRTLETLSKMSPTSLKVVLQQVQRGATLSYPEVFKMEYRMAQAFMVT